MILIRGLMVMIIGVVRCAAQDAAAMPECREGDSNCFVTVGHRLFGDKEYAQAIDMFTKANVVLRWKASSIVCGLRHERSG